MMENLMIKFGEELEKEMISERKENMPLFKKRERSYNRIKGIRVGDWVKENGKYTRVTYIWRDESDHPFQVQTGGSKFGRFYLGDGFISYSGGLDPGFNPDKVKYVQLKERREGSIWFFKNDIHMAHNSVEYVMKFRVFKVKG